MCYTVEEKEKELLNKLEQLRNELHKSVEQDSDLNDKRKIELSIELDKLLTDYISRKKGM